MAEASSRGEIRGLTGLRLVAALWVVAHHFWLFAPDGPWRRHLEPVGPLLDAGWLGVDLFFVLSGFVLAHTYVGVLGRRPGLRAAADFYWARLSRIWPTWMVVLCGMCAGLLAERLLLGPSGGAPLDPVTLLRSVLLVQVWDRPHYAATGPVGPGWSLSAEWLAYLFFPVVVLVLYRLRGCGPVVLGALALAAVVPFAWSSLALGAHDWRWSWLLRLAGAFLAGALVAMCVHRIRAGATVSRGAARIATATVVLLPLVLRWAGEGAGLAVVLFPVLVGALALTDGGPARVLATPLAVLGGRISFALYLVHMAVFELCWTVLAVALPGSGSPAVPAAVLVLPLPAAWVLWRCVEEPARRRMRALRPARPVVAAVPAPRPVVAVPAPRPAADAPVPVHA